MYIVIFVEDYLSVIPVMFGSKLSKDLGNCLKKLWLITDKLSSQKVISEHFAQVGQKTFNSTQANKERLTFLLFTQ
jgi:hypothetical protein